VPWDIVGHSKAVAGLKNAATTGRVGHAHLFAGPEHIGKARLALLFAKALLCLEQKAGVPCDSCAGCRAVTAGAHNDLYLLTPSGASIGIAQVRAMQASLSLRPVLGQYKVCIVDDADLLTEQAQNAMLKIMEEPPAYGVLLLVVHRLSALLPTIISRSQVWRLHPVETQAAVAYLMQARALTREQAELLAAVSEGRIGIALGIDPQSLLAKREMVADWCRELCTGGLPAALRMATALDKEESLLEWLDLLALWLRDIWHVQIDENAPITNIDMKDRLLTEAAAWKGRTTAALTAVLEARRRLLQNANRRLTLDMMCINMQKGVDYDTGRRSPF